MLFRARGAGTFVNAKKVPDPFFLTAAAAAAGFLLRGLLGLLCCFLCFFCHDNSFGFELRLKLVKEHQNPDDDKCRRAAITYEIRFDVFRQKSSKND